MERIVDLLDLVVLLERHKVHRQQATAVVLDDSLIDLDLFEARAWVI